MMEKIADYILAPPPDGEDISGEIVPVADIGGRDAVLRKEDYYYLRELWSAFRNESSAYKYGFSSAVFRMLIRNILYSMNQWKSDTGFGTHTHMKSGLASYSFTGSPSSASYNTYGNQFFNWMKDNSAIELLDTSEAAPDAGVPMDADILRLLYRHLTKDMFRQVRDISLGGTRAFTFTTQQAGIPYAYVTLDDDDNMVTVSATGTIQGSNGNVVASGISTNGKHVGVHSLKKWDSTAGKYKYYNTLCFPSSTISANVTFSAPVSEAYALMNIYLTSGTKTQGLQLLRPMAGGGTDWSVELMKRSDFDLVSSGISFPTFDVWGEASVRPYCYHADVERVFARFSDPYFALPAEWDWSPS